MGSAACRRPNGTLGIHRTLIRRKAGQRRAGLCATFRPEQPLPAVLNILAVTGPIFAAIALGYVSTRAGLFARADPGWSSGYV